MRMPVDNTQDTSRPQIAARKINVRWMLCAAICLLYGISFILPAGGGVDPISGKVLEAYYSGWIVFVFSAMMLQFFVPFWLANPALWLGIVFLGTGRWRAASTAGIIGLVLGLCAGCPVLFLGSFLGAIGKGGSITLGPAYFVWMASLALLAAASPIGRGLCASRPVKDEKA